MNLQEQFKNIIAHYGILNSDKSVLVALSGGVDSVVLTELCKQFELKFAIAHCNFQLRGEESDRDEDFVSILANRYSVKLFVRRFDTELYAENNKLSIQEAARELRYQYFEELRQQYGYTFTLLAHNANDQIETTLMNFFRGTGLDGLTGMPLFNKERAHSLRPLLNSTREQILEFAKENNLKWVEDSSNQSTKYTRNLFRNEVIPTIQKVFPSVEKNLLQNINRFESINSLYSELIGGLKKKLIVQKGTEYHIPVFKLLSYQNTSLVYEIIRDFGFTEKSVDEVLKLADSESGKYISNDKWQIIKNRKWFVIASVTETSETILVDEDVTEVIYPAGKLIFKRTTADKFHLNRSAAIAQLDSKEITWPLILRKWKQGDYFYPFGMRKKKKVARFLIDQKISKSGKENIWVLESNKRVLWIVGHRIDDRFRITEKTKEVLGITLSSL